MVTEALTEDDKQKWKQSIPSNPPVIMHKRVPIVSIKTNAKTKQWVFKNLEDQVHEANKNLENKLMQIVKDRNLTAHLPQDNRRPSISKLVNILATNGVFPRGGEERTREYADTITRIVDKIDRGEGISKEEIAEGDYTLAIAWFELILDDIP
jgi:hypothetical protein